MTITGRAQRACSLDYEEVWSEAVPLAELTTISKTDRAQLIWGYAWYDRGGNLTITDAGMGAVVSADAGVGAVAGADAGVGAVTITES